MSYCTHKYAEGSLRDPHYGLLAYAPRSSCDQCWAIDHLSPSHVDLTKEVVSSSAQSNSTDSLLFLAGVVSGVALSLFAGVMFLKS